MIRSAKDLEAAIWRGETVARMPVDTAPGTFRTCIAETGETVFKRALSTLVERGTLKPIRFDLCGDPMQWGAA